MTGACPPSHRLQNGLSLVELAAVLAIASLLLAGLSGLVSSGLATQTQAETRNRLSQQAQFAMQRMVSAVQTSPRLLLPLADNPATDWSEHIRVQSVPPSPPEGSSSLASAVLAVTLDPTLDVDGDGWADANNDRDFLDINQNGLRDAGEPERIDEDLDNDNSNDGAPGLLGIDDDGDGTIDLSSATPALADNDEDQAKTEDPADGIDNDGDGSIDEDIFPDMSGDGAPGLIGVDDDLDGQVDEGQWLDDDEDGSVNEDWYDPVVFYLSGASLIERQPALSDQNGDTLVTGADFTESVIAEGVTLLRFERLPQGPNRALLLDITLELAAAGERLRLTSRVRLGGGL